MKHINIKALLPDRTPRKLKKNRAATDQYIETCAAASHEHMIISLLCRNTPCQIQAGCFRRLCRRWAVATPSLHYSKMKTQETTTGVIMNGRLLRWALRHRNVKAPCTAGTSRTRTGGQQSTTAPCRKLSDGGAARARETSLRMARSPQTKLMSSHEMKSIAPTTLTGASGSCRASPTCDPIQSHWFRPYFKFANPNVIDLLVAVDTLHRPTVLAHIHRTEHIFDSRVRMRW